MSKQKYRIDMAKRVIYVDANYLKMSQNPKTRAYKTVSELIDMHPTFEVKAEGIAKDRYNHLTYQTMENFFKKMVSTMLWSCLISIVMTKQWSTRMEEISVSIIWVLFAAGLSKTMGSKHVSRDSWKKMEIKKLVKLERRLKAM